MEDIPPFHSDRNFSTNIWLVRIQSGKTQNVRRLTDVTNACSEILLHEYSNREEIQDQKICIGTEKE